MPDCSRGNCPLWETRENEKQILSPKLEKTKTNTGQNCKKPFKQRFWNRTKNETTNKMKQFDISRKWIIILAIFTKQVINLTLPYQALLSIIFIFPMFKSARWSKNYPRYWKQEEQRIGIKSQVTIKGTGESSKLGIAVGERAGLTRTVTSLVQHTELRFVEFSLHHC